MPLRADWIARGCQIGLLCAGLMAGCATTPRSTQPLNVAEQLQYLAQLERFAFAGRVAVAPQGLNPSVDWSQQQDVVNLRLSGPLGTGSIEVKYSPDTLQLTTGRGEDLRNGDAERLLMQELGFMPPFAALRYWVLGVPAPGVVANEVRDEAGLLQQFEQQGWKIVFERRVAVAARTGGVQLPSKLTASRDGQRLRLVVDRWRLK